MKKSNWPDELKRFPGPDDEDEENEDAEDDLEEEDE